MKNATEKLSKGEMIKLVLFGLGALGILTSVIVCPGLAQLIPRSYRSRNRDKIIRQTILRLDKRGWIIARQIGDGWKIQVTNKGRTEFLAYKLGKKGIQKPKRWDKKWRLLIFDIPEKRKITREQIRRFLQDVGFIRLQDSVWVHPYECREVLELLRTKYRIRSEALYAKVELLDNDHWLKKEFNLKI
ncbi:CRISPR-associated endonuclease Cas2 [Candidatus Uhrbacteria bacterium]|nr:CRISPR-associated endonuclease Cas2 [Candidatus Uhrbacteria bacterium]